MSDIVVGQHIWELQIQCLPKSIRLVLAKLLLHGSCTLEAKSNSAGNCLQSYAHDGLKGGVVFLIRYDLVFFTILDVSIVLALRIGRCMVDLRRES